MDQDRTSGVAILLGAIAFVVTMALHPTGGDMEYIQRIAAVVVGTHSLAIVSLALITFGFLGLTRRLGGAPVPARAGMVSFAFAAAAGTLAAILNGLVLPAFVRHHAGSDPATLDVVRLILGYNHALNHSCAQVFMVASAVAVVFWSIAIVTTRALPRWIGIAGGIAGAVAVGMVLFGAVGVDVHDFGLFVFAYAAWALVVGVLLCRPAPG